MMMMMMMMIPGIFTYGTNTYRYSFRRYFGCMPSSSSLASSSSSSTLYSLSSASSSGHSRANWPVLLHLRSEHGCIPTFRRGKMYKSPIFFISFFSSWRKFWLYSVNFDRQHMAFFTLSHWQRKYLSTLIRNCQPLGTPCLKWVWWSTQYYQSGQFREWRWLSVGLNVQSTPCKIPSLLATIANRHRCQFLGTDIQVLCIDLPVQTDKEVFNVSRLYFLKIRLT